MLARRLTTILPAMTLPEAIETTPIPRVAGRPRGGCAVHPCGACRPAARDHASERAVLAAPLCPFPGHARVFQYGGYP
jgi:predicted ATPase with chaperone activity